MGCVSFELDYLDVLVQTYGTQWVETVEVQIDEIVAQTLGEREAYLYPRAGPRTLWLTGADRDDVQNCAQKLLEAMRSARFTTHHGEQAITCSLGVATSACADPPFEPGLCFETLETVAAEGRALAIDAGGDRCAHSELYDFVQRTRERKESNQVDAQRARILELRADAEHHAPGPTAAPVPRGSSAPTTRPAASRPAASPATDAPTAPKPAPPLPSRTTPERPVRSREPGDQSADVLRSQLHQLLAELGEGRADVSYVERRIGDLVHALVVEQRNAVSDQKDQQYGSQVDLLERRLAKLNDALAETEERLRTGAALAGEAGDPSAYRSVQGLSPDEPAFEMKRDLMDQIFRANLELAHELLSEDSASRN